MVDSEGSIKSKVRRSTLWGTVSRVVGQGVTFITTIILARLLLKEDFGLMSMSMVYMGLLDTFIDFGFLNAIIQSKEINKKQISSCFWLLFIFSFVMFVISMCCSPYIAWMFGEQRIITMIKVAAFALLFIPAQIICKGLLSRDLRLDILARLELVASILRAGVAVILAYKGYAAWSLILGFLCEKIVLTAFLLVAAKWLPRFEFDKEGVKPLMAYGMNISLGNFLWYIYCQADVFVIGRCLGPGVLGVYTLALQFGNAIFQFVSTSWQRILFPIFSKYQQSVQLKEIFFRSSAYFALITMPMFVGLAALAPDIVSVFLGDDWAAVIFPMQILSLVAALKTLANLFPYILNAIGRPSVTFKQNLFSALIFPPAFYLGAHWWGLNGVLAAWLIIYPARYFALLLVTSKLVEFSVIEYVKQHAGTLAANLVMFLGVTFLRQMELNINIYFSMILCVFTGAGIYVMAQMVFSRWLVMDFLSVIKER
jgi:O-antigen/teichoic acid export membrane protein